jgi:hypothetical protein
MKHQNFIALATLGLCIYEEAKHPYEKKEHTPHESHATLIPNKVNVYNISGRIEFLEVNGAVLATRNVNI